MASNSNIKAVVTIAGKIDPSLQSTINKVSKQFNKLSTDINKSFEKISKSVDKTFRSVNKSVQNANKSFGSLSKSASKTSGQITKLFSNANKSILNANKSLGKAGNSATSNNKSQASNSNSSSKSPIPDAVSALGSNITDSIISVGKQGFQLAMDLQKVQGAVDATFGSSSNKINGWAKNAGKNFGLSELQAKQFSTSMGEMLKNTGVSGKGIVEMSEKLTGLSGQMASFNNISQEDAFKKIQEGISGDEDSLKDLGINMSEANLEAYALTTGTKNSYKSMDEAAKTQLRYKYLMDKSKDAQEAYKKNQNSFGSQIQLVKMNFEQLIATVISKILPALTKAIGIVDKLVNGPYQPFLIGLISTIGLLGGKILLFSSIIPGIQSAFTAVSETVGFLNPQFILISLAIGALVGAGWYLYKNWGTISKNIVNMWQKYVMPFFNTIGGWFSGICNGVITGFKGFLNWIIDEINVLIKALDSIKFHVPNWVPILGGKQFGINISPIPHFSKGGIASQMSIFGEAGPEMAIPLKHTPRSIGLLNQTAQILGVKQSEAGPNVTINLTINSGDGNPKTIASAAEDAIVGVMEKYFGDKARVAYGQ